MRPPLALFTLLFAGMAEVGASSSQNLVRIEDGGELIETERTAEFSIVDVRRAPSGSVASSMYALRGTCAVARARGAKFVQIAPVPGASNSYKLTFPSAPTESQLRGPEKNVFSLSECEMLRF